jgi:hypothetical protein
MKLPSRENKIFWGHKSLDGGSVRCKAVTYTQNKRTQTSLLRVGFEPPTPLFERAKTVHALHRVATVIRKLHNYVDQLVTAEEDETYI